MSISFPVLLLERDSQDVMRFDSVFDMQEYLERIDIENDEYVAWDSTGRALRMAVQEPVWLKVEPRADLPDSGLQKALEQLAESRGIKLQPPDKGMPPLMLYEKIIAHSPRPGFLKKTFRSRRS